LLRFSVPVTLSVLPSGGSPWPRIPCACARAVRGSAGCPQAAPFSVTGRAPCLPVIYGVNVNCNPYTQRLRCAARRGARPPPPSALRSSLARFTATKRPARPRFLATKQRQGLPLWFIPANASSRSPCRLRPCALAVSACSGDGFHARPPPLLWSSPCFGCLPALRFFSMGRRPLDKGATNSAPFSHGWTGFC
jgi:hypothetical protein